MFNKFSKRSGVYHIKDNIECLELRIYFRHVDTLLKLPKFDYNKNTKIEYWNSRDYDGGTEVDETESGRGGTKDKKTKKKTDEIPDRNENDDSFNVVDIKWQQKLLSEDEQKEYRDLKNCSTDTQKQYHEWILAMLAAEEESEEDSSDRRSARRRRKKTRSRKHKSKQETQKTWEFKSRNNEIFTYVNEDCFKPKDAIEYVNPKITKTPTDEDIEHMYVYAALKPDTQLVHLQWYRNQRLLHIYPDFNSFSENPYFIELDTDYRHLYAYGVENISAIRQLDDVNRPIIDYLNLPEITTHWQSEAELSKHFSMPPKRTRRVSLLLELKEAEGFSQYPLHVRYSIQLPANTIHEEGHLEASTHSATPSRLHNGCHFGYNLQITLLCEELHDPSDPLRIYLEVVSIDSWQRERIEGYAYQAIHLDLSTPPTRDYFINCLRPVDSFWESLNRFFIGGRRHFNYKRFFNNSFKALDADDGEEDIDCFQNRYGCRMQQTGRIHFAYQMLTQRNCELLRPCSSRASGMTLDDIMLAYKEATSRLEALIL